MISQNIDEDNGDSSLTGADLKERRLRRHDTITNMFGGAALSSLFFNWFDFVPPMPLVLTFTFLYVFFVKLGEYYDPN